ncbi:hypothetical protein LB505_005298 [Fusarium chuoi]|nr:hypothetical protein LB505_005298 [Fusarium chuoi]
MAPVPPVNKVGITWPNTLSHYVRGHKCLGWDCLTPSEQAGIITSATVILIVLLFAYMYYLGRITTAHQEIVLRRQRRRRRRSQQYIYLFSQLHMFKHSQYFNLRLARMSQSDQSSVPVHVQLLCLQAVYPLVTLHGVSASVEHLGFLWEELRPWAANQFPEPLPYHSLSLKALIRNQMHTDLRINKQRLMEHLAPVKTLGTIVVPRITLGEVTGAAQLAVMESGRQALLQRQFIVTIMI